MQMYSIFATLFVQVHCSGINVNDELESSMGPSFLRFGGDMQSILCITLLGISLGCPIYQRTSESAFCIIESVTQMLR